MNLGMTPTSRRCSFLCLRLVWQVDRFSKALWTHDGLTVHTIVVVSHGMATALVCHARKQTLASFHLLQSPERIKLKLAVTV